MKKQQILATALVAVMLFMNVGCNSILSAMDELNNQQEEVEVTPTPEPTQSPEEIDALLKQNKTLKQNAYIGFSNMLTGRFYDSISRYERYFGLKEKIIKPKSPSSPYTMGDSYVSSVNSALEYASMEPAMADMDSDVKALAPLVLETMTLLNNIVDYYDMKNYVDDDYEKGIEYHAQLIALNTEITPLMDQFSARVAQMDRANKIESMEELREAGLMVQYYTLESMLYAEDIINFIIEHEIDDSNIHKVKADDFKPYYDALAQSTTNFMDACNEGSDPLIDATLFSMFKSAMTDLKSEASSMYERIQNSKRASSSFDHGIPSAFVDTYNEVVSNYNRLL